MYIDEMQVGQFYLMDLLVMEEVVAAVEGELLSGMGDPPCLHSMVEHLRQGMIGALAPGQLMTARLYLLHLMGLLHFYQVLFQGKRQVLKVSDIYSGYPVVDCNQSY